MEEIFSIVESLQGYSIPVRARVETSDFIRPFVGSERLWRMREAELQRKAQTQPKVKLPSVADIQCTQNAGHGGVTPSGGGIAAIPRVEHRRATDAPRTSVRDALMTDGEPMPSVKAAG